MIKRTIKDLASKQFQGAECLKAFCKHFGIEHPAIDELVAHLESLPVNQTFSAWERRGAGLHLVGRGDATPADVTASVPEELLKDFDELVEYAVEIGIADAYGADTEMPDVYLQKCVNIAASHKVNVPG